ncbi:MAG: outer membrane protein transport protein [Chlamydiia bacterium]|nr:outer membrane protein transport protein [Chlamydiia bacterium]
MKNFFIFCLLTASTLFGAALRLTELGTPDMGVASAGSAAIARDAATAYFNPAGLTHLDHCQLLLGTQVTASDVHFKTREGTLFRGGGGSQAGTVLPGAGAYYNQYITGNTRFGLAINSPYGGRHNYGRNWAGRYFVHRIFLPTIALNPSLAYQFNSWLSVGAGYTLQYAYLQQTIALNPAVFGQNPFTTLDGHLSLNLDSFASGYNFGLLIDITPCIRLGATYRSKIDHKFHGSVDVQPLGTQIGVDTKLPLGQFVILSLAYQPMNCLILLASGGWEDWSTLDRTIITTDINGEVDIPRNWKDTWHAALGAEYTFNTLTLQLGASYDSSPARAHYRSPDLPMDNQWRFSTGLLWQCNSCERLSTAFEYAYLGRGNTNLKAQQADINLLKGHYNHNSTVTLNLTYCRTF